MALFRKSATPTPSRGGWLAGLLGSREIESRVDESFPTWDEYSEQKIAEAQAREEESQRLNLPPHRLFLSSPLHGSFLYFFLVLVALALGIQSPELAPVLVYAAIGIAVVVSLFVVFRDALFFHIEGLRLLADSEMINKHARGPQEERDEKGLGFLRALSRKRGTRNVFRSSLLQIHYQNVLRTFEQGNRRAWVDQDASIADLHTLLSQRGMKLVWTMIEVLPQLGLLGTLIGLMRMFMAFRGDVVQPELEILAGFATALGTTVLANLIVLMLRPLYMRNERAMHEILSSIQTIMAMFILPTQQSVLERQMLGGFGRAGAPHAAGAGAPVPAFNENRLYRTLEELTGTLGQFTETQRQLDSGTLARETSAIASQVKETLRAFHDAVDRDQIEKQQKAIDQLSDAVRGLARNLNRPEQGALASGDGPQAQRIVHDLAQLRVLTHDTLLLLEQIAGRLDGLPPQPDRADRPARLLSRQEAVRAQLFEPAPQRPGLVDLDEGKDPGPRRPTPPATPPPPPPPPPAASPHARAAAALQAGRMRRRRP